MPPNYSPSQHGDVPQVPHNEYPTEGMTMYCRAGPPSATGSAISANTRPSSRDDQSEISQPSSYTSADPMSGKNSPIKGAGPAGGVQLPGMASPEKSVQKKRSGFFSNSPFRRKSKREPDHQAHNSNRNTWNPSTNNSKINVNSATQSSVSQQSSPVKFTSSRPESRNVFRREQAPEGEEPADPRASFQLNVGNNVFDVASPDSQSTPRASMNPRRGVPGSGASSSLVSPGGDLSMDPVAQALAELKSANSNMGMGKQASMRVQADRHLGVQTPGPDSQSPTRPSMISAQSADKLAAQRGTPPPAYDVAPTGRSSALGVPQPAFTSREMRSRTETWGASSTSSPARPPNGNVRARSPGPGMPRAASPQPQNMRARSPGPGMPRAASPQPQNMRARSPGPGMMRARSPGPQMMSPQGPPKFQEGSPYPRMGGGRGAQGRPGSSMGMEMQLSNGQANPRPSSAYGGQYPGSQQNAYDPRASSSQLRRERSKSMAAAPNPPAQQPPQGVLHYGEQAPPHPPFIPYLDFSSD